MTRLLMFGASIGLLLLRGLLPMMEEVMLQSLPEVVVGPPLRSKNPMAHPQFSMLILSLSMMLMALQSPMMEAAKLLLDIPAIGIVFLFPDRLL